MPVIPNFVIILDLKTLQAYSFKTELLNYESVSETITSKPHIKW